MINFIYFDDGICNPSLGVLVPDHPLDPTVDLQQRLHSSTLPARTLDADLKDAEDIKHE